MRLLGLVCVLWALFGVTMTSSTIVRRYDGLVLSPHSAGLSALASATSVFSSAVVSARAAAFITVAISGMSCVKIGGGNTCEAPGEICVYADPDQVWGLCAQPGVDPFSSVRSKTAPAPTTTSTIESSPGGYAPPVHPEEASLAVMQDATVTVQGATTVTVTITSFTLPATTVVVRTITETQVLTMINPTARTQTVMITVTSLLARRDERTGSSITPPPGITVTSTVFAPSTISATLTITDFVSETLAPAATATVTVRTTVSRTPNFPGTSSETTTTPAGSSGGSSTIGTSLTSSSFNTMMTMITMMNPSSSQLPSPTTEVAPSPTGRSNNIFSDRTRLAGLIIGLFFMFLLIIWIVYSIFKGHWRRLQERKVRRQLTLPRTGGAAGIAGAVRTHSGRNNNFAPRKSRNSLRLPRFALVPSRPSRRLTQRSQRTQRSSSSWQTVDSVESGSHSGLTGEGEVRIVIRPAPTGRGRAVSNTSEIAWPLPPSHTGRTVDMYVDDRDASRIQATSSHQNEDENAWSITSNQGTNPSPATTGHIDFLPSGSSPIVTGTATAVPLVHANNISAMESPYRVVPLSTTPRGTPRNSPATGNGTGSGNRMGTGSNSGTPTRSGRAVPPPGLSSPSLGSPDPLVRHQVAPWETFWEEWDESSAASGGKKEYPKFF